MIEKTERFYNTVIAAAAQRAQHPDHGPDPEQELAALRKLLRCILDEMGQDDIGVLQRHPNLAGLIAPRVEEIRLGHKKLYCTLWPDRGEARIDCDVLEDLGHLVIPMDRDQFSEMFETPRATRRKVQEIFPSVSPEVREALQTGTTPLEWRRQFGPPIPKMSGKFIKECEALGYVFEAKFRARYFPVVVRCPDCGETENIRYVEDIQNWRQLIGTEGEVIAVEGSYQNGEGYDDGINPHWECHGGTEGTCLKTWPVSDTERELLDFS